MPVLGTKVAKIASAGRASSAQSAAKSFWMH